MGKWFLAGNSATIGRILMIFSAVPHETKEMVKNSLMARLRAHALLLHYDFGQNVIRFFGELCFSFGGIN